MDTFQALSLDGGGIKGLFSASVLAELEADLGVRLIDHFDLIVGTSTGGLIALALGLGVRSCWEAGTRPLRGLLCGPQ